MQKFITSKILLPRKFLGVLIVFSLFTSITSCTVSTGLQNMKSINSTSTIISSGTKISNSAIININSINSIKTIVSNSAIRTTFNNS